MNTSRSFLGAVLLAAALIGCDAAPLGDTASASPSDARPADRCMNVRHAGLAQLGAPVLIPVDPYAGSGALPTPTQLGPYDGLLSSILTDEVQMGNGAIKYRLVHYFEDGAGNAFWTDDHAVCSPVGNDPATCLVNDRLTVVGGTGDFGNAEGFLHNRGLITLTEPVYDPDTGITTFGTLEIDLHGRICGDGL
ncbi:MAG TPA: hypothetical protein VK002_04860 [Rubricoccaceae bacterium]|nr:hypothetical protein [Rubricoccaceae bacterium]